MSKGRLEAFSDGVLAIIITIMVLQLPPPHGSDLSSLRPLVPVFLSYVLSYVYIGIYWNNHHHLLQATEHVAGGILWANLNLLFWLSLIPFTTAWVGASPLASWPLALYAGDMLFAAIAYFVLTRALIAQHGRDSMLASSIGSDRKGTISLALYLSSVILSFVQPWAAIACLVVVPIMGFFPDRRIEKNLVTAVCGNEFARPESHALRIRLMHDCCRRKLRVEPHSAMKIASAIVRLIHPFKSDRQLWGTLPAGPGTG